MAERDLHVLMSGLTVTRQAGVWTFQTGPAVSDDAIMTFREQEGWTTIRPVRETDPQDNRWAWLELSVFSDLNAVGFLAEIASALSKAGIPCNAVAAFHHDHVFVPEERADAAVAALQALRHEAETRAGSPE